MLRMRSESAGYSGALVSSANVSARAGQEIRQGAEGRLGHDDFILRAVDLVHQYGQVTALDHVSLDVRRGEFLTILGESGSGKTTMLRVISGLEKVSHAAQLTLDGVDVRNVPAAKRNCTTVFQSYALFPHMSVEENVGYGLKLRGVGRDECRRQANEALEMVRLSGKASRRIGQLSGGERQRVALAAVLCQDAPLLLLDEPLSHLDLHHQIEALEALHAWIQAPRRTVMFSCHDLNLARRFATHALLLDGQGGAYAGVARDVLSPTLTSRAFGYPLILIRDGEHEALIPAPRSPHGPPGVPADSAAPGTAEP
jgi:ABC-type sugar transport system ATPase subunit